MKAILSMAVLALTAGPAAADRYAMFGMQDETVLVLNIDTIQLDALSQKATAWTSTIWLNEQTDGTVHSSILYEVDCRTIQFRSRHVSAFKENGASIVSESITSPWSYVAPETLAANMVKFVCKADTIPENRILDGDMSQLVRFFRETY